MAQRPSVERILIVEDEPDILHAMALILKDAGYEVLTSTHAAMALDTIEKSRPDLIVTDYMMPWMDGRAFVDVLRKDQATQAIPVIMLSAVRAEKGPWDAHLRKPVEYDELLATVRRLLDRGRRPRR